MNTPPLLLDGAKVLCYSRIDERHRQTGNTSHSVFRIAGSHQPKSLVISQYPGEAGVYLFYCDDEWNVVTDTWHEDLSQAMAQAEFEFEGMSNTWMFVAPSEIGQAPNGRG